MAETIYKDIVKAAYEYEAQADDELSIKEEQLLYLLGRADEDWSRVQAHIPLDALTEGQEAASGLVPAAYVEPAVSLHRATAMYDYEANGAGEIGMKEGEKMHVYLKEDEWVLVKLDREATAEAPSIGYVPANYVEEGEGTEGSPAPQAAEELASPSPPKASSPPRQSPPAETYRDPAELAASAATKSKADQIETWSVSEVDKKGKKKKGTLGVGNGSIFFASESDKTPVQQWPSSTVTSVEIDENKHKLLNLNLSSSGGEIALQFNAGSKDTAEAIVAKIESSRRLAGGDAPGSPPKTNGIARSPTPPSIKSPTPALAPAGGSRLLPPPSHPGTTPSPSGRSRGVHFDPAPPVEIAHPHHEEEDEEEEEEYASPALSGRDVAVALYDFDADGDDELTVKEGEKIAVIDKEGSEEWWKCRNAAGKEGVVPASYLELDAPDEPTANHQAAVKAAAEQERREQEEAAARAAKAKRQADELKRKREEQAREDERRAADSASRAAAEREKQERNLKLVQEREARQRAIDAQDREEERRARATSPIDSAAAGGPSKNHSRGHSKDLPSRPSGERPKPTNTRIWHDRSGQFKVDAEFLGVHNGKIRLHKSNGVVIEVPTEKMSPEDMDYIRRLEARKSSVASRPSPGRGSSTEHDNVPLGELRKPNGGSTATPARSTPVPKRSNVDWFDFFLTAGCDMDDCTRYAASFERDKIDESILADLDASTLRTLGLREGDIIRVVKKIQQREYKAQPPRGLDPKVQEQMQKDEELAAKLQAEYDARGPGRSSTTSPAPKLFSGPNGSLKNNTRRKRPTPTKSATLGVDSSSLTNASEELSRTSSPTVSALGNAVSPPARTNTSSTQPAGGFDDDAWTPRPASTAPKTPTPAPVPVAAPVPAAASVAASPPPPPPPVPVPVPVAVPVSKSAAQTPSTQSVDGQGIQRPATSNAKSSLATEFDVLAKLGTMRPPSAPVPQNQPPPSINPPTSYSQGLGVGSSPLSMGTYLHAQPTGVPSPLQAAGGPRAPLAPVPANETLLKPLIPTTTGFNSFVPTRPGPASSLMGHSPGFQTGAPSLLSTQPTGFGLGGFAGGSFGAPPLQPLQPTPTGFSPPFSQPTSAFSTASTFGSSPGFQSPLQTQPTGFANFGAPMAPQVPPPNAGNNFINALQSQTPSAFQSSPVTSPPPQDNAPANVFAAMKAGSFANPAAPQGADKYNALRPQPTGYGMQSPPLGFGANQQTGFNGLQPRPTGFGGVPQFQAGFQPQPTGFGFQQQQPQSFAGSGFGFQR